MEKIKVGVIGTGYIGDSHIETIRRLGCLELAAIADINYDLAKKKADAFGVDKVYRSVDELIGDDDIQAIHNCTPNSLHTSINKKIINAGKHLLSEKPLATTYREAAEIAALKKEFPNTAAAVNFNYRLNPMVQEMRNRIRTGKIGKVRITTGMFQQDWLLEDTDYSWRLEPETAGPSCAIADIGSHWMDLFQYVTDDRIKNVIADLETVIPVRKKPKKQTETFTNAGGEYEEVRVENEEYGAVLFRTEKGVAGVFHVSELAAGHGCYLGIELNGSEGSFGWNQEQNDRLWVGTRGGDNGFIIRNPNTVSPEVKPYTSLAMGHPEGWNDAFKGNIYAFYRYIADGMNGEPLFATLEEAAYVVRLTEAIIESCREKKWVEIR